MCELSSMKRELKIAIVGGGISGCTAYLQLKKHLPGNHDITIYEAYSTDKNATHADWQDGPTRSSTLVVGGGLGLGPNGLHVLQRLDENLVRDIVRSGYVISHGNMKDKNGRLLVRMDTTADPASSPVNQSTHLLGCSRHALWRCLRGRIPDRDVVCRRIEGVIANPDGRNVITFVGDINTAEADLVIGADGLKSTVKRALFPGAEDPYPPRYEGLVGIGGFIPADQVREHVELGSMNFILGGNGFFGYFFAESDHAAPHRDSPYHVSKPGESLVWWSTYSADECPDPKALNKDDVMRQLQERHADWGDPVIQKILHSLRVDNMYPTWTSPALPEWERFGVVLVGDAAHALPPTSGQGSSQALEDVEALTMFLKHQLGRIDDKCANTTDYTLAIRRATKEYEQLRQPHVANILKRAQQSQNSKRTMGWVEEYAMYWFMWVLGFFPGWMTGPVQAEYNYNVAEDVERRLR